MSTRALRVLLAVGLLAGCAVADTPSTGTRGMPRPAAGAPAGSAGASAPIDPSGFGNSAVQMPPVLPPDLGTAGNGSCEVGVFCPPATVDTDDCGSLTLEGEVEVIQHPGNVLLVFDTSQSMAQQWNGQTRWEAAGAAITNAMTPLADMVSVGTVFFPRPDPNAPAQCVDPTGIACIFVPGLVVPGGTCGVTAIDSADQINFQPGPDFLTTFAGTGGAAPPYAPVPGGLTPLKEGLQQAQSALAGTTREGITSVVVITDGDPNCQWDAAVSTQIVTDWQAMGINTYVIGLPGTTGAGDTVLTQLAMAGGTGAYITPTDAAALEQKLREIATETVKVGFNSCDITINPPTVAPEKLHLVVTEGGIDKDVARDLSADASWNITDDGALVTLEGTLCDDAMGGRFEALRFEFGCVDLPPLPPTPPVE